MTISAIRMDTAATMYLKGHILKTREMKDFVCENLNFLCTCDKTFQKHVLPYHQHLYYSVDLLYEELSSLALPSTSRIEHDFHQNKNNFREAKGFL